MRSSRLALAAVAVATLGAGAGCGQASARLVQLPDSPITFQIPMSFVDLTRSDDDGTVYGRPGASPDQIGDDPIVYMASSSNGDMASFKQLRMLATNGQFDPLDPSLTSLPDGAQVLDYKEITDGRVWGIRLKYSHGPAALDFQALIDRTSNSVVVTEVTCTQACFTQQATLIEHIQGSWSLES